MAPKNIKPNSKLNYGLNNNDLSKKTYSKNLIGILGGAWLLTAILIFFIFAQGCKDLQSTPSSNSSSGSQSSASSGGTPPDFTVINDVATQTTLGSTYSASITGSLNSPSGSSSNSLNSNIDSLNLNLDIDDFAILSAEANSTKTANKTITLQMSSLRRNQMKIGSKSDCSDGKWVPYSEFMSTNLPISNDVNNVSVMFMDYDLMKSICVNHLFILDDQGPEVVFRKYPTSTLFEGSSASLSLTVDDKWSKDTNVICSLLQNGSIVSEKPCFSGMNLIQIASMPVGHYEFVVEATDDLKNSSKKSMSWDVQADFKPMVQSIVINDYKKVDILFVVDNSASMKFEQQSMANRTSHFLSILKGLDWQIGITTTDPSDTKFGDGRLVPIKSSNCFSEHDEDYEKIDHSDKSLHERETLRRSEQEKEDHDRECESEEKEDSEGHDEKDYDQKSTPTQYLLTSNMDENLAQNQLSETLHRTEIGSGSEQGIRAVTRAIERFNSAEAISKSFIRENSQFAAIVISDEDEANDKIKNDPENLIRLISSSFTGQKRFSFHSIITKPGDSICKNKDGKSYGYRYQTLSDLTGGFVGSVCESDYSIQVQKIATGIRNLLQTLSLSCEPVKSQPIIILKDGSVFTTPYTRDGLNLRFNSELESGKYSVQYQCLR